MSEVAETKKRKRWPKIVSLTVLAILCLLLLVALALRIYLASSLPAPQLSRVVTGMLHQGFSVQQVQRSGSAIVLKGVRLQNPPGFPKGYLASADSVTIVPEWGGLLRGDQRYRLIALQGIRIDLVKNASGAWNYQELERYLTRKPAKKETIVDQLVVKDGALKVQGEGVQGVSLHVFNLASKGSLDSTIDLALQDPRGNRYFLKGKARPGKDAALDLTLTAPALSLEATASELKMKHPSLLQGGKGNLLVKATLHQGEFTTSGELSFTGTRIRGERSLPVAGVFGFAAAYDSKTDSAQLKKCTLTVNRVATLQGRGSISGLKSTREYRLRFSMDDLDLGILNLLLSDQARKKLLVSGRVRCDSLRIEGDRQRPLKSAQGTLQLRDGALTREGRLLVAALTGGVEVSREQGAIVAKGKLFVPGRQQRALVESLSLPFSASFTPKLKLSRAEFPELAFTASGIAVSGKAGFDPRQRRPYTASLKAPAARLTLLNDQLKRYGFRAQSGVASVTLQVAAKSARELAVQAKLHVSGLRGEKGKNAVAVEGGSASASVVKAGEVLSAQGDVELASLQWGGRKGDARFGYRLKDGVLYLDNLAAGAGDLQLSAAHLSLPVPKRQSAGGTVRYPLSIDLAGGKVKQRGVEVTGLGGRLRGTLANEGNARWLEGTAELDAQSLLLQGKKVAAPSLHALFTRSGGSAKLSGDLLGGKLSGTVSLDPFSLGAGEEFDLAVTGAGMATAAEFLPQKSPYRTTAGTADVKLKGDYTHGALSCSFDSKGSGITLVDAGGKTLVSGAALSLAGDYSKGGLALREGVVSAGEGAALKFHGELAKALTPERKGTFLFSLPQTPLNSLVDPFVNILPRFLQEANLDGKVAADGSIALGEGRKMVEGGVTFTGAKMEVPGQKILVSDLTGRFPVSMDLSGKSTEKATETIPFSRENYPRLLAQLKKDGKGGELLSAGTVSFGGVQLGKLTMHLSAANGITEITSLESSIFGGMMYGKGHVSMRDKLSYRGDMLINNLSLKALCSMFPNITGYISGRVDGILSIGGEGTGLAGMKGFTDLWAREGSGEKMLVSKEFLQRLAKRKITGFFFRSDRPYDRAEIKAILENGELTFDTLTIEHTNFIGVKDLNVSIAPESNRIAMDHLFASIKEAAVRGKPSTGAPPAEEAPAESGPPTEFKWGE